MCFGGEVGIGKLALAVLVEVGGHGLGHDVAVETELRSEGMRGAGDSVTNQFANASGCDMKPANRETWRGED